MELEFITVVVVIFWSLGKIFEKIFLTYSFKKEKNGAVHKSCRKEDWTI